MRDGVHRSKDPTNSIKVLKEKGCGVMDGLASPAKEDRGSPRGKFVKMPSDAMSTKNLASVGVKYGTVKREKLVL